MEYPYNGVDDEAYNKWWCTKSWWAVEQAAR